MVDGFMDSIGFTFGRLLTFDIFIANGLVLGFVILIGFEALILIGASLTALVLNIRIGGIDDLPPPADAFNCANSFSCSSA